MKRLCLIAAVCATAAMPALASAQGWRNNDVREERRELREEQRDAARDGVVTRRERREIQEERRELQDARRDRWNRSDRNWWRGRSDFRGYNGRRTGFWYAPGYGYVRAEPRWNGYRWRRGGYVPSAYRRYYVQNPAFYGVRAAPPGHRWVWVDNNLVLMRLGNGLIVDLVTGVY